MTDRAFTTLINRAQPSVPGCPYATIKNYVRDSAIKVCERTLAYRYEIPLFDLLPGVHEYTFDRPSNTDVHAVFAALMNGSPLAMLTLDQAIERYPAWADLYSGEDADELWSETPSMALDQPEYGEELFNDSSEFVLPDSIIAEAATPAVFCQLTPQNFIVVPLPDDTTYEMRLFVALKPTRDATGMETKAFDELEDVILHKALEDLLVLPNVPWTNPDLAMFHSKKFQYMVHERRARANLGHARGSLSARMHPWA